MKIKPKSSRTIGCTSFEKTEDGTLLVSISDRSSRAVRSKYPLHDELIKQFKRSEVYKDSIVEDLDVSTDLNRFELRGATAKRTGSDLLGDSAVELTRVSSLLSSPVEAFRMAQIWSQGRQKKIERFGRTFRKRFFDQINKLVTKKSAERWAKAEVATQLSALDAFLSTSASLLRAWRSAGKLATRWWYENSNQVMRMHHAQERLRRRYGLDWRFAPPLRTSMPWEVAASPEEAKPESSYDLIRPVLLGTVYLADQDNIRQAARSVSYLIFRHFLLQKIKVSFCRWCGAVFEVTERRTTYCCDSCGKCDTSAKAKFESRSKKNLDRVKAAITILEDWLEHGKARRKIAWRTYLEIGLRQRKLIDGQYGHASQIVGRWINASLSPKMSANRMSLAKLCTRSRPSSRNGAQVAAMVDKLLALIERAKATEQQRSKLKSLSASLV